MATEKIQKTHWKKIVSDPNFLGEADFLNLTQKPKPLGAVFVCAS